MAAQCINDINYYYETGHPYGVAYSQTKMRSMAVIKWKSVVLEKVTLTAIH